MKKNKMMRLASVLLVLTLLSTSVISGTFAKYVTTDNGTDSARVAHWGVQITPDGTLFEKTYATTNTATYSGPNSVVSSDTWDVIAPGTDGQPTTIALSGTPEVAYKVEFTPTITMANWEAFGSEYCPIIFTVNGTTYGTNDTTATNKSASVADLITAVQNAIIADNDVYDPGESLATAKIPVVSWNWPFEVDLDADGVPGDNDAKDSYLGQVSAGVLTGSAATIEIDIAITVTQVD